MRKQLCCVAVTAAVAMGAQAFGADAKDTLQNLGQKLGVNSSKNDTSIPQPVQAELTKHYGTTATTHVTGNHDVNGVKVYDVTVNDKNGQSTAAITETGNLLFAGMPAADAELPAPVKDVSENLFQSPSKDVEEVDREYYFANVQAGQGTYQLKFDATGRLLDARSYMQEHQSQTGPEVTQEPLRHNLADATQKIISGAVAHDVHQWGQTPGYYVVSFSKDNQPGWVVMNQMGSYYGSHVPVAQNELPPAVQKELSNTFKSEKVKNLSKGGERYYRVQQEVGGEKLVLMVHGNGDVMSVESASDSQAMTAAHHMK